MADTKRTLSALLALFPDNSTEQIDSQQVRDFVVSVYGDRTPVADANKTIASTDSFVAYTSISAPRVATLPLANSVCTGYEIIVGDESGSVSLTNTITVQRSGSDTINNATSVVIAAPYGWRRFISDGTSKWTFDGGILRSSNNLSDLQSASTARTNLSLNNVTNDAQLKRAAGDYATFTEKTTPADADLLLIEDSADSGNKKKMQLVNSVPRIIDSIQGLIVSINAATPLSKVDISIGGCRSDDNAVNLDLVTPKTGIDIAASGANGLDAGSEEASQWYAVWLIYNPTTATYAGLLSVFPRRVATNNPAAGSSVAINLANTKGYFVGQKVIVGVGTGLLTYETCTITVVTTNTSITVSTLANSYTTPFVRAADKVGDTVVMPSGYTKKRRVGFVRNNASSNFIPFVYIGQGNHRKYVYRTAWATDRQVLTGGTGATWTGVHCADHVPTLASIIGIITQGSTAVSQHQIRPYGQTVEITRSWGATPTHKIIENWYSIVEFQRTSSTTLEMFVEYFEEDL